MIVLLVVAVLLVALSIVGGYAYTVVNRLNEERIRTHLLDLAHTIADSPQVREAFVMQNPALVLQPLGQGIRSRTAAELVIILGQDGTCYAHPNPSRLHKPFQEAGVQKALAGHDVITRSARGDEPTLYAFTPIYARTGQQLGVVGVAIWQNTLTAEISRVQRSLCLASGGALLLGIAGAVALAQSIKRTIFGLEPRQIATLLQQREAILSSVREGIVAIDRDEKIVLANDEARRIIAGGQPLVGRPVTEAIPNTRLPQLLRSGQGEYDCEQLIGETSIVTNRLPIVVDGEVVGAVASFREKTAVARLAEELTGVKRLAEALRSQKHEFINRLHTVSGLLQLGLHDQALAYISKTVKAQQDAVSFLTKRVQDPATAGLILGKISEARERGVALEIDPASHLADLPRHFQSNEMAVVLGNLLQNAIEAVEGQPGGHRVWLALFEEADALVVKVRDNGPGIAPALQALVFERGVTSKERHCGLGLFLVQRAVQGAGGSISITTPPGGGCEFTVSIPIWETTGG
jgi:sensor histidine kinase regulating citrate/malate metabolism